MLTASEIITILLSHQEVTVLMNYFYVWLVETVFGRSYGSKCRVTRVQLCVMPTLDDVRSLETLHVRREIRWLVYS